MIPEIKFFSSLAKSYSGKKKAGTTNAYIRFLRLLSKQYIYFFITDSFEDLHFHESGIMNKE